MKKRTFFNWVVTAALLGAVALIGCPNGGGDDDGGAKQSGSVLEWVKIGTLSEVYPNETAATVADAVAAAYDAADIPLTNAQKAAAVTYQLASTSDKASVEIAQVAKADQAAAAPAFSGTLDGRTYVDEDWLVVKVTSEDGSSESYYRFNISLGRNALLESVTIGTTARTSDVWLGKPGAAFAGITIGDFQTDFAPNAFKFAAEDPDAAVSYVFKDLTVAPTDLPDAGDFVPYTAGATLTLPGTTDNTYLFIKVVPTSPQGTTLYYIMKLVFPKAGSITYGVPKLVDPANPGSAFYIDPIWDAIPWEFDISRANQAESVPDYFKGGYGKHTAARAKAMWDDGGIWVLVDADVSQFRTTASGALVDRPITPTSDHNGDSLEVFINERLQILGTVETTGAQSVNDIGNQFRLGVAGDRTGETASAVTTEAAADTKPTLAPFNDATFAKFRTVLKKPAGHGNTLAANYAGTLEEATNGGFMMIAYAPFKFSDSANADAVFDDTGKVKDGATIGFELQLNVNSGSSRDGILTWNGLNTMAYQNAAGFGVVTLKRDNKTPSTITFPEITAQTLSNAQYAEGATTLTALSVTTTSNIQWFTSPTQYGAGTAVPTGGTTSTLTPETKATTDTTYYYAVVTGTDNVAIVTNTRAKIQFMSADDVAEKWTILNPKLTAGWTTPAADGTVTIGTGDNTLFGYKFPVGSFYKVELTFEGTVTSGGGSTPLKFTSKQFNASGPTNGADYTTAPNRYMDITVPASGAFTFTRTYDIDYDTTKTGDQDKLYYGGLALQTNTNQTEVSGFKVSKAVFFVKDANDGSFYVNLANLATQQGNDPGQWYMTLPPATFDANGYLTWAFDNTTPVGEATTAPTGNGARQRAIINLTEQQRTKANSKAKWTVEIAGAVGTPTTGTTNLTLFFAQSAMTTSNWNVTGGDAINSIPATPLTITAGGNYNQANQNFQTVVVRQANASCVVDLTINYIKITPID